MRPGSSWPVTCTAFSALGSLAVNMLVSVDTCCTVGSFCPTTVSVFVISVVHHISDLLF